MLTEGGSAVVTGAADGTATSETAGLAEASEALSWRVASTATSPPIKNAATPTTAHSNNPRFEASAGLGFCATRRGFVRAFAWTE